MRISKAQDILKGLSAAQKRLFRHYVNNLRSKREGKIFDSIMYRWLKAHDRHGIIEKEKEYLDSLGYTASEYDPEMIQQQIARFQEPDPQFRGWNKGYKLAVSTVAAELSQAQLKVLKYNSDQDVADALPRKDTHAGFSWILTGFKKKGDYLVTGVYEKFMQIVSKARAEGSFNCPILIGTRTQASGAYDENDHRTGTFKKKTRLVSMIDIFQILAELIFAKPVQQYMSDVTWYAGGKPDSYILSRLRGYSRWRYHMFTIDYSSFDQTIPSWVIYDAFEIIKGMFNDSAFDDELFNIIRNDFIHKVFIDVNGELREAHKGVPSGSMFTQLVDSIVNRIMVLTYAYSKGIEIVDMMIMGDDNIIITNERLDENDLTSYLNYMFGVVANADKCVYTEPGSDPEFLSRYWTSTGVYRSPYVLLAKLLYPERFREYKKSPWLKPELIVYSYYLSFPRGMEELVNRTTLARLFIDKEMNKNVKERRKWMTGLERYRAMYEAA